MLRDIVGRFAAAGGVTDMDGISQVKMLDHGGNVGGVMIHVVTAAHLRRTAMAAPVMGDDAVAFVEEIEHLRVPIVTAQRPPMVEDDWLGPLRPPVLVKDFRAVFGGDRAHYPGSYAWVRREKILLASRLGKGGRRHSSRNGGGQPAQQDIAARCIYREKWVLVHRLDPRCARSASSLVQPV